MKASCLRIIDANLNRSREGLRVCEDILRFLVNDRALSSAFKLIRHRLSNLSDRISAKYDTLNARSIKGDVGKKAIKEELTRKDFLDIFKANIQRTEESFRVLEEVTKIIDIKIAVNFKKLRFRLYELEKKSIPKIKALCSN